MIYMSDNDKESITEGIKMAGDAEYNARNYRTALELYSMAILRRPDSAVYYCNRAACYMMTQNYRDALNDSRKAICIDSKFERACERIAKCCTALGDFIGTEQAIKKLEEINPSNSTIITEIQLCEQSRRLEKIAEINYENKSYRDVVYYLDNALKTSPACRRYKLMKAECLLFLGRIEEATNISGDVLRFDGISPEVIYIRGLCMFYTRNIDRSIIHFKEALKLEKGYQKAKLMLSNATNLLELKNDGIANHNAKEFIKARDKYTEALKIDPLNVSVNNDLYYNRALAEWELNNMKAAIADCSQIVGINKQYLKALLLRARCSAVLENYRDCVADYKAAYKLYESNEILNLHVDAELMLKRNEIKISYKILGLTANASSDEIKRAYRREALSHHPDKHQNSTIAERKFKEVVNAYSLLLKLHESSQYEDAPAYDISFLEPLLSLTYPDRSQNLVADHQHAPAYDDNVESLLSLTYPDRSQTAVSDYEQSRRGSRKRVTAKHFQCEDFRKKKRRNKRGTLPATTTTTTITSTSTAVQPF